MLASIQKKGALGHVGRSFVSQPAQRADAKSVILSRLSVNSDSRLKARPAWTSGYLGSNVGYQTQQSGNPIW